MSNIPFKSDNTQTTGFTCSESWNHTTGFGNYWIYQSTPEPRYNLYRPIVSFMAYTCWDCEHWQGYVEMPLFRLHVQVFQPRQQKIQGTVCLLHGYLEHSGIYQTIIQEILEQGLGWLPMIFLGTVKVMVHMPVSRTLIITNRCLHAVYEAVRGA